MINTVCLGTSPRATLSGRAALLTQEGVTLVAKGPAKDPRDDAYILRGT